MVSRAALVASASSPRFTVHHVSRETPTRLPAQRWSPAGRARRNPTISDLHAGEPVQVRVTHTNIEPSTGSRQARPRARATHRSGPPLPENDGHAARVCRRPGTPPSTAMRYASWSRGLDKLDQRSAQTDTLIQLVGSVACATAARAILKPHLRGLDKLDPTLVATEPDRAVETCRDPRTIEPSRFLDKLDSAVLSCPRPAYRDSLTETDRTLVEPVETRDLGTQPRRARLAVRRSFTSRLGRDPHAIELIVDRATAERSFDQRAQRTAGLVELDRRAVTTD